jgi:ribonuclease HI
MSVLHLATLCGKFLACNVLERDEKTGKYLVRFHYEDRLFSIEMGPCDFLDGHGISAALGFDFLNECFMLVRKRLADDTHEMKIPSLVTPFGDQKRLHVQTAGAVAPETHQGGWCVYFPRYDWHLAFYMPGEVTRDYANGTAILRALQFVARQGLSCTEITLEYANDMAIHHDLQNFLQSYDVDTIRKGLSKRANSKAVLREFIAEIRKLKIRQPHITVNLSKTENALETYDVTEQATTDSSCLKWTPQDVQPQVVTQSSSPC